MRAARIILKGLSDTLENLLAFTLASIAWWLAVCTILLGPGATIALFRVADPRIASTLERPGLRESGRTAWRSIGQGWRLVLPVLPLLAILLWNLNEFGFGTAGMSLLAPLWLALLLAISAITFTAIGRSSLFDEQPGVALRGGVTLVLAHLPRALGIALALWLMLIVGGLLVVPLVMFLPATLAATANRFLLDALGLPVADPLAPTDERAREEAVAAGRTRFGP